MTPIEEAQVRVAKVEDEKAKLHQEVIERYGSVERMGTYAQSAGPGGKKAADLRKRYNHALKELRLAKSDLARMKKGEPASNGERAGPEGSDERSRPQGVNPVGEVKGPADHGDRTFTPIMSDASAVVDSSQENDGYLKVMNDGSSSEDRPAYMKAMDRAAETAEATRTTSIVISDKGVSLDGGAPVPREAVLAAIDVIKGRKKIVQQDLEGKQAKAPLSGRIKIPPERFELETPSWVLKGPKEVMLDLVNSNARPAVKGRVQKGLRAKKDAMINDGDFDQAVERFTDEIMRGIIRRLPEDE